jgi:hypothetical protein
MGNSLRKDCEELTACRSYLDGEQETRFDHYHGSIVMDVSARATSGGRLAMEHRPPCGTE